ncbi:MAG TPA: CBS domain-containing protein [Chloroflexota bacterium]
MRVKDVMIPVAGHVEPETSLRDASATMKTLDLDPIPVLEGERVVGMLTERDVLDRVAREGLMGGMRHVEDVMSTEVFCCWVDQDVAQAMDAVERSPMTKGMERLPVINRRMHLVGMVSVRDLREHDTQPDDGTYAVEDVNADDQIVDFDEDPVEYMSDESFPASDPVPPPSTLGPDRDD